MQRPRIGMPLCLDERGRWRAGRTYHYIDGAYADAIERAGGRPVYLPLPADPDAFSFQSAISELDGLLLPGGDDLPPEPGDPPLPPGCLDLTPDRQLHFDTGLAQAALANGRPILGICYGMQLLARIRGGRLDADLETLRPSAENHQLPEETGRHPVRIETPSRLAEALGNETPLVNSLHHQALRSLGPDHRAVAWSPDGLLEALENPDPDAPFEIGVQWHPEKLAAPESDRLFRAFVRACWL